MRCKRNCAEIAFYSCRDPIKDIGDLPAMPEIDRPGISALAISSEKPSFTLVKPEYGGLH